MAGIVDYFDVSNERKYTDAPYYPHIITKDKAKHWRYHSRNEYNIQQLRLLVDSVLEQGRVRGHLTVRLTNERCLPRSLIFKQKTKHIPKFRTFSSRVYFGYIDQFPLNYIAKRVQSWVLPHIHSIYSCHTLVSIIAKLQLSFKLSMLTAQGLTDTSVHSYMNTSLGNSNAKYSEYLRQSQNNFWVTSVAKYNPEGLFFKAIHMSTYRSSKFKYKMQIKDYQRALKMRPEKVKQVVKNLCNLSVMGYKEWCWYMFSKYYLWRNDSDNELRYDRLLNLTYQSTKFNRQTLIGPPIRKQKDNRRALVILNISRHITKTSADRSIDEPQKTVAFKSLIPISANVSCGRRGRIIVINTERLNFRLLYYVLENLFHSGKKIGCLYAKSNFRHLLGRIKKKTIIMKQINQIRKWPAISKYSKTLSMLKKRPKQYIQDYLNKLYKRFHRVKIPELILIQEFVEDTESSLVSKMKSPEAIKPKIKPKIAKSMTAPGKVEQIEAPVKKWKKGKRPETVLPKQPATMDKKAPQKKNKKTKGGQKKGIEEDESKHDQQLAKFGSMMEMDKEDNKKTVTRKRSVFKGKMKSKRRIGASPSKFSLPPKEELCEYPQDLPVTPMVDKKDTKPKPHEPSKNIFRNKTMSRRYFKIYGTAKQHKMPPTITGKLIQAPFKRSHYSKYVFPCMTHIYDIVHYPEQIKFAMNDVKLLTERLLEIKADMRNKTLRKNRKHKFIIISTLLTWANTPTLKKKEKISEGLFQKRVPNSQYVPQYHFENYIIDAAKLGLFEVLIIGVGLVYGDESIDLQAMFRLAMEGNCFLPVFGKGRNCVPLIHVHEITRFIKIAIDDFPDVPYIFLTEPKVWTQNDLVRRLSLQFCNHVEKTATYRSLHYHIPKYLNDIITCNFKTRFTYANNVLSWGNKTTIRQNLRPAIRDYIRSKRMEPIRIALYGPPCAGKTHLAKILAKYYDVKYISMAELIAAYIQIRDYFLKWTIGREMTVLWRIKQRWLRNEKSRLLKLLKTTLREKFIKCLEKLAEEEKKGAKNVPSSPTFVDSSEEDDSSTSDVEDISRDDSMESDESSIIEGEEDAVETEEIPQILDFVPDHIYMKKKTNKRSIGTTVNYSVKSKVRFNKKIKDNVKKKSEKRKKILAKRIASEKFNLFVKRIKDILKRKEAEEKRMKGDRKLKKHKPVKWSSLESSSKHSMVVVKDVLKKMQKDKLIKKKRGSSSKRRTFRTSRPGNEKVSRLTLQPFRRFVTSDIIQSEAEDIAGIYIGPYKLYGKYLKIDRLEEVEEKEEGKREDARFEFTWKGIFLNWDERRPEWEVDSPVAWSLPWMMPWTAKRIQAALDAVTLPYVVSKEEAYRQRVSFQGEEKSSTDLKDIDESKSDEIKDTEEEFYDADEVPIDVDVPAADTDEVEQLIGDTYFEMADEFGTSEIGETYGEKDISGGRDRRRKSLKEETQILKRDTRDKKEILRERYKEYLLKIDKLRKESLAKAKKRERQKKLLIKKQKEKEMLSKEAEEKAEIDKEEKKMVAKIKKRKSKKMKLLLLKRPRKIRKLTDNDRVAWSICMYRCCPNCCPLQFSNWFVDGCNFVIREKHKCCKGMQHRTMRNTDRNMNQLANRFLKRKLKIRPMITLFRFKSKIRLLQKKLSNIEKVNNYFSDKKPDVCLVPSSSSSPGTEDEVDEVDESNEDDKPKDTLKAITIMPAILRKFEKFQFRQSVRSKMTSFMRGVKKLKRAREYIVNQIKTLTRKLRDANYKVLFRFLSYLTDVDRRSTLKDLPETVDRLSLRQSRLVSKRKKRRKTSKKFSRVSKIASMDKFIEKRSSFEKPSITKTIQDKTPIATMQTTQDPNVGKFLDPTMKQSKPGLDQPLPKQPVGQKITDPIRRKSGDEKAIGSTLVQLKSLSELQELHRQQENRASIITHTKEMYIDLDYLTETKKKIQSLHKYRSFISQWSNTRSPNIRPKKYFRFFFIKRKHRRKIRPFLKILQQDWGEKYDITTGRKPRKNELEDTKLSVGVQCVASGHIKTMRYDDVLYPIRIYTVTSDGLRTIMSVKFNINERYFSGDDDETEDYDRDLQDIFEKSDDTSDKEKKRKKKPKKGDSKKNRRLKDVKDRAIDERRWRKKKKIQEKYYKIFTKKIEQSKLVGKIKKKSIDDKKYMSKKYISKKLKIVSPFNKNKKGKKKGKGGKKGKKLAIAGKAKGGKNSREMTLYNFIACFTNKKFYKNIKEKIQKHFIKLFKFINTLSMQEDIELDMPTYFLSTLQAFTKDSLKYAPKFDYNLLSKSLNAGANIRYKNFLDNPKQYIFTGNIQVFQLKKLKKKKRYKLISLNERKLQIKSRHSQLIKKNDTKQNGNIYNIKTVIKQNYRKKNMKLINKLKAKPLKKYKLGFARIRQLLDERCINFIEPTKEQTKNIKHALQEVKKFKVSDTTEKYHCHKTAFSPNRRAHKLIKCGFEVPRFIYKHFINSNRHHQLSNNYFWIQTYEVVRRCIQNVNQKKKRIYQEWNWRWLVKKRSPLKYIWNSKLCNTRQQILRINHRLKFISWQRKKEQIRHYVQMFSLENLKSIDIKDLPELLKHSLTCYAQKKNRVLTHCIDLLVKIWESAVLFQYENDENLIATIMGEILRMNEYKTKGYVLDGLPMSSMAARIMFKPRFTELFHKKQLRNKIALIKLRRKPRTRHKLKVKNIAKIRNHLRRRAQLVGDYARSTNLHSMVIDRFKEFLTAVKMGQGTIELEDDPRRYSVLSEDSEELRISPATAREKMFNQWKYMKLLKSRLDLEEKYNPDEFKKILVKSLPAEEYTYICDQLGLSDNEKKDPIFSNLDYSLVQAWKTTLQEVIELLELNNEVNKKVTRAKGTNSLKHLVQSIYPKRAKLSNIRNVSSFEYYINLAKRKFNKGTRSYRNLNVRTFTTLKRMYPDEDILEVLNEDKYFDTLAQQNDDKKRGDEKADNVELSDDQLSNETQLPDEDFFTDDSEALPDQVLTEIQKPLSDCYKRLRIHAPSKQIVFPLINVPIPKPKTILKILKYRNKVKLKTMKQIKKRHLKEKRKRQKMMKKRLKRKKIRFIKNVIKHIIERKRRWKAKYICLPKNERPKKFVKKPELIVKLKNLLAKHFKKVKKPKEDKTVVKRMLYIQRKLDEKRDKSITVKKGLKVVKDGKCKQKHKHRDRKKEKEDKHKKKHKRKDKQAVSSDKLEKNVKPGGKNKPELKNSHSLAEDKNAVNHKYSDKNLIKMKKPRISKHTRQNNEITKYKPEISLNKKHKQNNNYQKSITAKGKFDNLSTKVKNPKKSSKTVKKKLEQNIERRTKFSEKPLVLLDPIFENKFHHIAMEQIDPHLSTNRSDNMNLTYRVVRMPSLTKFKRKQKKQKKKYSNIAFHVLQRKMQLQSLPLCDCQKGFRLPVISFPTKQHDRYFLCNIKRILRMQAPSGPRVYINRFGKLMKEEICVPKKQVFVNASIRVPHIKRLKKKLNVQTNYMPQWVFNITRRATYLRTFSKCDNLIEMSTVYKRINFYWFHDSLNPTFLDYMQEKDVPVWTFNVKSRTDDNIKKLFIKLTEIIGPAKRKASATQPYNPSWLKNYPLNINLELSDKYNINICADMAKDPNQIWQEKCLNPITEETQVILRKYFQNEAKQGEVLNMRLLTEKEVKNILELDKKQKQREAIFQNYIDEKVKSVGKHLFWYMKQFYKLRTYAKNCIMQQMFIPMAMVVHKLQYQSEVESEGEPPKPESPAKRSKFTYLDDIVKTPPADIYSEPYIQEDAEPGSSFTIPSFDDEVSDERDSLKIPIESRGLLEENMLEYLNYTKSVPSSKSPPDIIDEQTEEIQSEQYEGEELESEEGKEETLADEFSEGEQVDEEEVDELLEDETMDEHLVNDEYQEEEEMEYETMEDKLMEEDIQDEEEEEELVEEEQELTDEDELQPDKFEEYENELVSEEDNIHVLFQAPLTDEQEVMLTEEEELASSEQSSNTVPSIDTEPERPIDYRHYTEPKHLDGASRLPTREGIKKRSSQEEFAVGQPRQEDIHEEMEIFHLLPPVQSLSASPPKTPPTTPQRISPTTPQHTPISTPQQSPLSSPIHTPSITPQQSPDHTPSSSIEELISPTSLESPLSLNSLQNAHLLLDSFVEETDLIETHIAEDIFDQSNVKQSDLFWPAVDERDDEYKIHDFYDEIAICLIKWTEPPKKSRKISNQMEIKNELSQSLLNLLELKFDLLNKRKPESIFGKKKASHR